MMMKSDEDDDDEVYGGIYGNGHWEWDSRNGELMFVSDFLSDSETGLSHTKVPISTTTIEFRDEVDLIEQVRYRRRYRRRLKTDQPDVVTLQDIKDLAIYTAPSNIMNSTLIDFLHLPTTEKFMRAVILYCQYYIQVSDEMENRMMELENKIRTKDCDIIENELRDSLCDLRILVAKEYCTMILGGADTLKYHHMGPQKRRKSLSSKDARFFETFLRIVVQIVWLALGRQFFNIIEVEINRLFKSDSFNVVEHTLQTKYLSQMPKIKREVLVGACHKKDVKMQNYSPLMNELTCQRPIDYRLMGLGVIKVPKITSRLQYMLSLVCELEEQLASQELTLGIIGLSRERFDTMLRPIAMSTTASGSSTSKSRVALSSKSKVGRIMKLYPDISLPDRDPGEPYYPPEFPSKAPRPRACSETQRLRWQQRFIRQRQSVFTSRISLK